MEKKSVKDQPKELSFIDCTVKHNNEILNVVEMKKIRGESHTLVQSENTFQLTIACCVQNHESYDLTETQNLKGKTKKAKTTTLF